LTTNTAASVGWGVYTYGSAFSAGASVPVINTVIYDGEETAGASVTVVYSSGDGIKIEIPNDATGSQVVVVYGRKPFYYRTMLPITVLLIAIFREHLLLIFVL